ncbi:MAG: PhoH family protein [Anaerobiospirillum sp.]|nr:PhoH family protein [Anaerobiospirillum sp.]
MTKHTSDAPEDGRRFSLEPVERERLLNMLGPEDENIHQIASRLGVEILNSGPNFIIKGQAKMATAAERIIKQLYLETAPVGKQRKAQFITPEKVNLAIIENTHVEADQEDSANPLDFVDQDTLLEQAENARATLKKGDKKGHDDGERGSVGALYHKASTLKTQRGVIKARTPNQAGYIAQIIGHDVSFGIGPAGTGKTFLAVAAAVDALTRNEVRRIILTRPAVEAGEKLGFLPGDLTQKVDPYLRPLYDALFEMLGFEKVEKLIERQVIEIAPLAYMRGRTLNDSFIILDEAQNTTIEQMKMFLTRIGFNSKAVITGDPSQIDLPRNVRSGLRHAMEVLKDVDEISFTYFLADDVVRHPVVAAIVNAYEAYDKLHANDDERERRPRRPRLEHQAEQLQAESEVAAESAAQ